MLYMMTDSMKMCPTPSGAKKRKASLAMKHYKLKYTRVGPEAVPAFNSERGGEEHRSPPKEDQPLEPLRTWALVNTFTVRPPVSLPFLMGCTLGERVMIRDLWSEQLFMTDLTDGTTHEAFAGQLKGDVFYCVTLESDRMAYCDSRSGLLHICTTQGIHLKTISLTHRPSTHMYHITVDRNGRVVYGVRDGKIFIIDPEEGKIVSSFSVDCKIEAIAVTTSGHIVIKSGVAKFNVIRDGAVVHSIVKSDWSWAACVAHPTEDLLYIAYCRSDDETRRNMVVMRPSGEVLEDDVFQEEAPTQLLQPSMSITNNCNIVLCDNGKLLVYRHNRDYRASAEKHPDFH